MFDFLASEANHAGSKLDRAGGVLAATNKRPNPITAEQLVVLDTDSPVFHLSAPLVAPTTVRASSRLVTTWTGQISWNTF